MRRNCCLSWFRHVIQFQICDHDLTWLHFWNEPFCKRKKTNCVTVFTAKLKLKKKVAHQGNIVSFPWRHCLVVQLETNSLFFFSWQVNKLQIMFSCGRCLHVDKDQVILLCSLFTFYSSILQITTLFINYLLPMTIYILIIHDRHQRCILNLQERIMENFLSSIREQLRATVYQMTLGTLILSIC